MEALEFLDQQDCEEYEDALEFLLLLEETRYINPRLEIPKSKVMRDLFDEMPPRTFKQIVRMNKSTFGKIVALLSNNPVFRNRSRHPQQPVWFQLMM